MKNLKKVLSLILVVAMACSMMVFASAKDYKSFPDADKISDQYTEAVDVIAALGIFAGDDEGYLNPQGTFTRAQAAKIVTYLSIGATAAERLSATGGVFKDVPATHWASKYIAYAYNAGILSGDGDGNYRPNDAVKGSEVAKMMNTVLGYGKTGEYSGASWELNAISHGVSRGLITGSADLTAPAKREEVIQYVFNTIDPRGLYNYYVEYSSITGSYVKSDGSSNWSVGTVGKTNIGAYVFNLSAVADDDASGRPTHYWKSGATILTGEYISRAPAYTSKGGSYIYTDDTSFRSYDLESANKLTFASSVQIYHNGLDYVTGIATDALSRLGNIYTAGTANYAAVKLGVTTEIYLDDEGAVDLIVIIEKTVAQALAAPTYSFGAVSKIAGLTTPTGATFAGDLDIVAEDIVLYYTDAENVVHVEKAEAVEGQLTNFTDSVYAPAYVSFMFSGTSYTISGLTGTQYDISLTSYVRNTTILTEKANYNVDSTIWLDDNNSIVWFEPGQGLTNYVYLLQTGTDAYNSYSYGRLIKTDGTYFSASIKVASGQTALTSTSQGWYSYTESSGVYTLKAAASPTAISGADVTVANSPLFLAYNSLNYYGNSSTVFLVVDSTFATTGSVKVVTGVSNLPSGTNALKLSDTNVFAVVNGTDGYAKYVFLRSSNTLYGASNVMFISNPSNHTTSGNDYVTYASAIVNGVTATSVKVDDSSIPSVPGLYNVTLSGDIYTVGSMVTEAVYGATLNAASNALVDYARGSYNVSSSAGIYELDSLYLTVGATQLGMITTYNTVATSAGTTQYYNYWYVLNSAGTITELYFQQSSTSTAQLSVNAAAAARAVSDIAIGGTGSAAVSNATVTGSTISLATLAANPATFTFRTPIAYTGAAPVVTTVTNVAVASGNTGATYAGAIATVEAGTLAAGDVITVTVTYTSTYGSVTATATSAYVITIAA